MDEIVRQAMAKWPQVPDCFGWLALDARGDWYLRDDAAQAEGSFACGAPGAKGSRLRHDKLIGFIGRNYGADADGRWYFQNGPQRVYVELERAPWVWRLSADFGLHTHTGLATHCLGAWLDEYGWLYLHSPLGLGLVHTLDMELAAQALEQMRWPLQSVPRQEIPVQFGFQPSPAALQTIK